MRSEEAGQRRGRSHLRWRGVTLVELLVVMVIITVAAGVILPRMGGSIDRHALREAAARLAHTASTLHELAIARQQTFALEVDLERGVYGALMQSSGEQPGEMVPLSLSWLQSGALPTGIRIVGYRTPEGTTMYAGTEQIQFRADGTSSGGAVRLGTEGERKLEYLVVVHPHSGQVTWGDPANTAFAPDYVDLGD